MRLEVLGQQDGCTRCELHDQGAGVPREVGLPTRMLEGSPSPHRSRPTLLYVGQNPGLREDEEGTCFVGPSGDLLRDVYIKGISADTLASVWLTNAVRCHTLANTPPPQKCFRTCMDAHFLHDVDALLSAGGPMCIVTLGAHATRHVYRVFGLKVTSLKKAFSVQGTRVVRGLHELRIYSTYHPAAVIRERNLGNVVAAHNSQILQWLKGNEVRPSEPVVVPPYFPPTTKEPRDGTAP